MKTLLILRHGKAEGHSPQGDKGRALTGRGGRDAAAIGQQILDGFGRPDLIVASDAARARQTAQIVATVVGCPVGIETRGAIYEADVDALLGVIRELPNSAGCVLLVGHNPGLEQLAGVLDAEAGAPPSLPTAGLIPLQFETDTWEDVRPGTGRRRDLLTPKHHTKEKGT
ncbi:MAG: histidine phosphatase family protein [Armatimonadetes bacterium]|nr:histidine phosphatase family protein [Armatimonadota bacterium]